MNEISGFIFSVELYCIISFESICYFPIVFFKQMLKMWKFDSVRLISVNQVTYTNISKTVVLTLILSNQYDPSLEYPFPYYCRSQLTSM